jgi:hypothetical protein
MTSTLTPAERQEILRRLKHGPTLSREELAGYVNRLKLGVLNKREEVKK